MFDREIKVDQKIWSKTQKQIKQLWKWKLATAICACISVGQLGYNAYLWTQTYEMRIYQRSNQALIWDSHPGYFLQTNGSGVTSWQTNEPGQLEYDGSTGSRLTLGGNDDKAGSLVLNGISSGTCTIQVPAVAGVTTFRLPDSNGSGQILR